MWQVQSVGKADPADPFCDIDCRVYSGAVLEEKLSL